MTTRSLAHRVRSFAVPPLLSTVMAIAFLPVLARAASQGEWVALAVGQSVGTVASIAINLGWSLSGPAMIAPMTNPERRQVYLRSLRTQGVALVILAPVAVLVSCLIAPPGHRTLAAAMTLATGLAGLAPTWFNIGIGSARNVLVFDVLPRAVAIVLSLAAVLAGLPVLTYPMLLAVAGVLAAVAFFVVVLRSPEPRDRPTVTLLSALRRQVSPGLTELAGGSYSAASLALVASQATVASTTEYASGSRLYQFSLLGVVVVSQAFQGWVNERDAPVGKRLRQAMVVHGLMGVAGLVGIGLLGHYATRILFGERLEISFGVALAFGVAFLAVALNTGMGRHILIVSGQSRVVMTSTLFGAMTGVPLTLVCASRYGATGGAWALAVSELVVCACQLPACRRVLLRLRRGDDPVGERTTDAPKPTATPKEGPQA